MLFLQLPFKFKAKRVFYFFTIKEYYVEPKRDKEPVTVFVSFEC